MKILIFAFGGGFKKRSQVFQSVVCVSFVVEGLHGHTALSLPHCVTLGASLHLQEPLFFICN